MHQLRTRIGFTLIELLVVITIIVVLLTLLTPALDKAIYETEMVTCASRQKIVASAVTMYATEFKRTYPYRDGVRDPDFNWWAHFFVVPPQSGGAAARGFDDRPKLRPYMSINALNDPFVREVDFDTPGPNQASQPATTLWAGFEYDGTGGGLKRIGDRLLFPPPNNNQIAFTSSILYGDWMTATIFAQVMYATHPDSNGALTNNVYGDGSSPGANTAGGLAGGVIEGAVISRWESTNNWAGIGTFDMNFALADGSVERLDEIDWRANNLDTRVERIGVAQSSAGNPSAVGNTWNTLPPR